MTDAGDMAKGLSVYETSAGRAPDNAHDAQDEMLRPEDRWTEEERSLPQILPLNMGSEYSRRAQREAEHARRRKPSVA